MYKNQLDHQLQKGLPHALLLYGDNDYYIDHYIDHYIDRLDAREDMLLLYYDEWNFAQAKAYLSQSSLFGGVNILIIRHNKKIPKKELDSLIKYANMKPDNYIVFGFDGEAKDAKSMQSSFSEKNGAIWVRFFESNIRDGVDILQKKAHNIGLDIDHYALQHLILMLNNNLSLCSNELDKLAILGTKITSKDIDKLVYSTAPLAIDQFLSTLFEKKPIAEMIGTLLDLGEDEASLMRSTQRFVNEIFLFNAYIKLYGTPDSKEILGYKLPKQIEDKKAQLAMRIRPASLLNITEFLLNRELEMKKSNSIGREALLYSTFMEMQRYL
jgi:DNA polymerase-3 subunit delta